jgi:hypothetical protein
MNKKNMSVYWGAYRYKNRGVPSKGERFFAYAPPSFI